MGKQKQPNKSESSKLEIIIVWVLPPGKVLSQEEYLHDKAKNKGDHNEFEEDNEDAREA